MTAAAVTARLDAIKAAVEEARRTVAEGGDVELAGIEDAVRAVCADLSDDALEGDRAILESAIRSLLADFDGLAEALGEQHRRALSGAGLEAAARSAYGTDRGPGDGSEGGV
jgi:cob(I)alamin adenosyltransferase